MSKNLIASFKMDKSQLEQIIKQMDTRTGSKTNVSLFTTAEGNTHVIGRAQDAMFVIGEVACHGEDGLIYVRQVTD